VKIKEQEHSFNIPMLKVTVFRGSTSQTRNWTKPYM